MQSSFLRVLDNCADLKQDLHCVVANLLSVEHVAAPNQWLTSAAVLLGHELSLQSNNCDPHHVSYLVKAALVWVSTSFMGSSAQSCLVLNLVTSSRKSTSSRARQYPCIFRQGHQ